MRVKAGNSQLSGVQRVRHTCGAPLCPKAQPEIATELIISQPTTYGLDAEKEKNVGLAFGIFGLAVGGSLYFLGNFWESLRLGLSVDAVRYLVDDLLAKQGQQTGQEIEASNRITLGLRTLLIYTF